MKLRDSDRDQKTETQTDIKWLAQSHMTNKWPSQHRNWPSGSIVWVPTWSSLELFALPVVACFPDLVTWNWETEAGKGRAGWGERMSSLAPPSTKWPFYPLQIASITLGHFSIIDRSKAKGPNSFASSCYHLIRLRKNSRTTLCFSIKGKCIPPPTLHSHWIICVSNTECSK